VKDITTAVCIVTGKPWVRASVSFIATTHLWLKMGRMEVLSPQKGLFTG